MKFFNFSTQLLNHNKFWYVIIICLSIPALFHNLGLLPFIDDEARRALVALEMIMSGNYVAPTLGWKYYYLKPPFYNWIIILFIKAFDSFSEFVVRLPMVLSLIGFSVNIFFVTKKRYGVEMAFIAALSLFTSARILAYESMLGLIDISYSWLTFTGFLVVYHYGKQNKLVHLFILSYAISAIAFLMKGFTTIAFQGLTIVAYFIYTKQFKQLFSVWHFVGGGVFIMMVGVYYLMHLITSGQPIADILLPLIDQSTQRTPMQKSFIESIMHLFTFPLEYINFFLPWTLFVVFLFKKELFNKLWNDDFLKFLMVIFFANIIVYWLSPEVYGRYLIVFIPLSHIVLIRAFYLSDNKKLKSILLTTLGVIISLSAVSSLYLFKVNHISVVPSYAVKIVLLFVALIGLSIIYWKYKSKELLILIAFLLVVKITYNVFINPIRATEWRNVECRADSKYIAEKYKDKNLYIFDWVIDYQAQYYISSITKKPLVSKDVIELGNFYMLRTHLLEKHPNVEVVDTFKVVEFNQTMFIVRKKE